MRHVRSSVALCLFVLLSTSAPEGQRGRPLTSLSPQEIARIWDADHVSPQVPPLTTHDEVVSRLKALVARDGDLFRMEQIGESVEGRSINHVQVGSGSTRILLWSQMHGDEPTATSALFDLFE